MDHRNDEDWVTATELDAVDAAWLATLFPGKDRAKISSWVATLHNNEFETFTDLANLDNDGWEALGTPLAITAGIKKFIHEWSARPSLAIVRPVPTKAPIDQIDYVVMDISGSMKSKSHIDRDKTREDLSKILFHSLMDKLVSLELSHAVGLIAFGSALTPIAITREYERFHDELGRLDANEGSTKLYDAILTAAEMIEAFVLANAGQIDHANLKKRVFVLTDGEDNASHRQPFVVAQYLQEHNILLDAIPVAGANAVLHALTASSGGLCFDVTSEEQGMALFESEATLHVRSREATADPADIPRVTDRTSFEAIVAQSKLQSKAPVREVRVAIPQTVFAPVMTAAAAEQVCAAGPSAAAGISKRSAAVTRRILSEYTKLLRDETLKAELNVFCSIDMNADDISVWKVWFRDLPDPYTGGTWLLTVEFPETYPFVPPRMRFMTPLYHCNVNSSGALCLDVLKEHWSPALSVCSVLKTIYALLQEPNPDDPLDAFKAQVYKDNRAEYMRQARLHTATHAGVTLEAMLAKYNLA
jgi:ubiquitin-protein ligase